MSAVQSSTPLSCTLYHEKEKGQIVIQGSLPEKDWFLCIFYNDCIKNRCKKHKNIFSKTIYLKTIYKSNDL